MITEPTVQRREAQPYMGIRARVTMAEIGQVVPPLFPEVFAWLERRGVAPAGPALLRYLVVDMDGVLEVEVGVPVAAPLPGDGRVRADAMPAGRYATLVHTGPPQDLVGANARLLEWGAEQGLTWDRDGDSWAGRVEHQLFDPDEEPAGWRTEVAMLVAGG